MLTGVSKLGWQTSYKLNQLLMLLSMKRETRRLCFVLSKIQSIHDLVASDVRAGEIQISHS